MNHRQLEYFIEVYRHKSIKKAAELLMMSPQNLSKIIKGLEEEMNIQLFIRKHNSLEPTWEAQELLSHAEKIVNEFRLIENPESFTRRKVRIYAIDGVVDYFIGDFIQAFCETNPDISLKIMQVSNQQAIEQLQGL